MLTRARIRALALYYAAAFAAGGANFWVQHLSLRLYAGPFALLVSLVVGTGVGFALKYLLDRTIIFTRPMGDLRSESLSLGLYAATAVLTTAVFWSSELAAYALGHSATWKYIGGGAGLALGYLLKYYLDHRYVLGPRR